MLPVRHSLRCASDGPSARSSPVACRRRRLFAIARRSQLHLAVGANGHAEVNGPTADLAVLYVILLGNGTVDQDVNRLAAIRTVNRSVLQFSHRHVPAVISRDLANVSIPSVDYAFDRHEPYVDAVENSKTPVGAASSFTYGASR